MKKIFASLFVAGLVFSSIGCGGTATTEAKKEPPKDAKKVDEKPKTDEKKADEKPKTDEKKADEKPKADEKKKDEK